MECELHNIFYMIMVSTIFENKPKLDVLTPLLTIQYFSYIVSVSFIGSENRSTRKDHRPAVNHGQTSSHNVVSSIPRLSLVLTHNVEDNTRKRTNTDLQNIHIKLKIK